MRCTYVTLVLASVLGLAGCQTGQPSDPLAVASMPALTSPSPSPTPRSIELPKVIAGLSWSQPKDPNAVQDWGMKLSLEKAFPQARAVAGVGLKSEKGYALLLGVVVTDISDPKAAIENAFRSMAARQEQPSVGLGFPRARSIVPGALGGMVLCGPADGGGADFPVCGWADNGTVGLVAYMGDDDPEYVESRIQTIRAEVAQVVRAASLT